LRLPSGNMSTEILIKCFFTAPMLNVRIKALLNR
jgi:hypothetical protein